MPPRKFHFPTVYDTRVQIATVTIATDQVTVRFHRRAHLRIIGVVSGSPSAAAALQS